MSLLSIGFSKAFNRMDHHVCLKAHADCSAFTESLSMIGSFLSGRKMRFKVNSTMSEARDVHGGSQQGTRLGNFLFVVSINAIEDGLGDVPSVVTGSFLDEETGSRDVYGLRQLAGRIGAIRRFNSGVAFSSMPQKAGTTDGIFRYLDASGRDNSTMLFEDPAFSNDEPPGH